MATPEAEETVAAPATTEEVVKSAEGGEKEAPKVPTEEPAKVEEKDAKVEEKDVKVEEKDAKVEEPKEAGTAEEPAATTAAVPEGEPTEPFKEESNVDLRAPETKALEELKARIAKAIGDHEFKVPKKPAEPPKEPETPKELDPDAAAPAASTAETKETVRETPPADTTTSAPPSEKKSEEVFPPTEDPPTETPLAEIEPKVEAAGPSEAPPTENPVEVTKEEGKEETKEVAKEEVKDEAKEETKEEAKVEAKEEAKVETKEDTKEEAPLAPSTPPTTEEKSAVSEPETSAPVDATQDTAPVEIESKTAAATPADGATSVAPGETTPAPVEEEREDTTPPEDVSLWGVPLLETKGDPRTDIILLKFLRARDLNVAQAFEQLKKAVIWRKTFKADGLLEEDFGKDFDDVSFYYGQDKDGHPVCYNVYSPFQGNKELYTKAFGDSSKQQDFIRWRIMVLEKGIKLLNFSAEGPNAMVQVSDVKYFPAFPGTHKNVKSAYKEAVLILQDNYPELVVRQIFVNAPWYFRTFYLFVSRYFSARQKSKVSFYSPGRTTEGLLKVIPGDVLPVAYGGLSKPNDPDFKGGNAPAKDQVIKGSDKATIELPVAESEGTIVFELAVTGYDVTYSAEYVPSGEGSYISIISKPKKLEASTQEPLRESFRISEPGKIVLTLDNSTKKKKIVIYRYIIKSSTVAPAVSKAPADIESVAEPEKIAG